MAAWQTGRESSFDVFVNTVGPSLTIRISKIQDPVKCNLSVVTAPSVLLIFLVLVTCIKV